MNMVKFTRQFTVQKLSNSKRNVQQTLIAHIYRQTSNYSADLYIIVSKVSKFAAILNSEPNPDSFVGFVKIKFSIHTQRQLLLLSCIRMILAVPALCL